MRKAVMISIHPKWCNLIASFEKTVEVRKSRPKLEPPFKCYIYCTLGNPKDPRELLEIHGSDGKIHKANGKVIGEFWCDNLSYIAADVDVFGGRHLYNTAFLQRSMCLTEDELFRYLYKGDGGNNDGWGWHIGRLVLYDKPKPLSEFIKPCENDLYCEICGMYSEFTEQCGNKALRLSRPPQSWCYVEELVWRDDRWQTRLRP